MWNGFVRDASCVPVLWPQLADGTENKRVYNIRSHLKFVKPGQFGLKISTSTTLEHF